MFISINIFQLLVNLICDATIPVQFKIENNFDTQFIKLDIYIYKNSHQNIKQNPVQNDKIHFDKIYFIVIFSYVFTRGLMTLV